MNLRPLLLLFGLATAPAAGPALAAPLFSGATPEVGLGVYQLTYSEQTRFTILPDNNQLSTRASVVNPQQRLGIRYRLPRGWAATLVGETSVGGGGVTERWNVEDFGTIQLNRLQVLSSTADLNLRRRRAVGDVIGLRALVRHVRYQRSEFRAGPAFNDFEAALQAEGFGFAFPAGAVREDLWQTMIGGTYARQGRWPALPGAPRWNVELGFRLPLYFQVTNSASPDHRLTGSLTAGYAVDLQGGLEFTLDRSFHVGLTGYALRRSIDERRDGSVTLPRNVTGRLGGILSLRWQY